MGLLGSYLIFTQLYIINSIVQLTHFYSLLFNFIHRILDFFSLTSKFNSKATTILKWRPLLSSWFLLWSLQFSLKTPTIRWLNATNATPTKIHHVLMSTHQRTLTWPIAPMARLSAERLSRLVRVWYIYICIFWWRSYLNILLHFKSKERLRMSVSALWIWNQRTSRAATRLPARPVRMCAPARLLMVRLATLPVLPNHHSEPLPSLSWLPSSSFKSAKESKQKKQLFTFFLFNIIQLGLQ